MSRINVIVASTLADTKAAVIAERVAARVDMKLIGGRHMPASQVAACNSTTRGRDEWRWTWKVRRCG